jgi:hypothetical protein
MPLVPRSFPPSKLRRKTGMKDSAKRSEHINIVGGREGPEVVSDQQRKDLDAARTRKGKPIAKRTRRFSPAGSDRWTEELAAGRTPEGTRTQSPFLRDVIPQVRAYARGLMPVSGLLEAARAALQRRPEEAQIELTVLSGDGRVVAVSGRLVDPDVDTLVNDGTPRWQKLLSRLAEELQAAQLSLDVEGLGDLHRKDTVPRVYLVYKEQFIPVEQFAVGSLSTAAGIRKLTVRGLYSPVRGDVEVLVGPKGNKVNLVPGTPVELPVADITSVSVDPPVFRQRDFVNTPAFSRSRGLVIEPSANKYGLAAGQPVTFPYSLILRLREIYPPAEDYDRVSSRAVETVKSTLRDFEVAQEHIKQISAALVLAIRAGRAERKRPDSSHVYSYIDPLTKFRFFLRGSGLDSTLNPTLVWAEPVRPNEPRAGVSEKTRKKYGSDEALYTTQMMALADVSGFPVTPVDFLRVLRAIGRVDVLKELRNRYR